MIYCDSRNTQRTKGITMDELIKTYVDTLADIVRIQDRQIKSLGEMARSLSKNVKLLNNKIDITRDQTANIFDSQSAQIAELQSRSRTFPVNLN